MASSKEIKSRISSVGNTKKITRTMELVATAKAKKATDRVNAAKPYATKIKELIGNISAGAGEINDVLLRKTPTVKSAIVLIVTSNRGLCGGFNNNVIKKAVARIEELNAQKVDVRIFLVGKKAVNFFKFMKLNYEKAVQTWDDKVSFLQTTELSDQFIEEFSSQKVDLVEVIYTKYFSLGKQKPEIEQLLPLTLAAVEEDPTAKSKNNENAGNSVLEFEESAEEILKALLPKAIRTNLYQMALDSVASEQIARRVAMKNATEAANDMVKELTLSYNRARQSKITQEIAEIVGGAAAIQ